jgi:hypothetical protein
LKYIHVIPPFYFVLKSVRRGRGGIGLQYKPVNLVSQ